VQDRGELAEDHGPVLGPDVLHRVDAEKPVERDAGLRRRAIVWSGLRTIVTSGCLPAAISNIAREWSTPTTSTPAAASIGQYVPVPQAASSNVASGPSLDRRAWMPSRWARFT
jgi:hypothetical protein